MTDAADAARALVNQFLADAQASDRMSASKLSNEERNLLSNLVPIKQSGFRGVVMTALIGRILYEQYDPLNNFYGMSPRTIFEKGIYYSLQDYDVPTGMSAPLNVAKNASTLDYNWAKGRRPEKAAIAAVDYIALLLKNWDTDYKDVLISAFFEALIDYAEIVGAKKVTLEGIASASPMQTANSLAEFMVAYPEGGQVPLFITGNALEIARSRDGRIIEGANDSVFATNKTSKKPADVWEIENDALTNLYEVTVKPVDAKRLDDCVDGFEGVEVDRAVVTFLCRIPEDARTLKLVEGSMTHRGMTFQFFDLRTFLVALILTFNQSEIDLLMGSISKFIDEPNRNISVKDEWARLVETLKAS